MLVIRPIAEGVGVTGGGLGSFATRLRLLGVAGGGIAGVASASGCRPSWAMAVVAMASVELVLRLRFFDGATAASAT